MSNNQIEQCYERIAAALFSEAAKHGYTENLQALPRLLKRDVQKTLKKYKSVTGTGRMSVEEFQSRSIETSISLIASREDGLYTLLRKPVHFSDFI